MKPGAQADLDVRPVTIAIDGVPEGLPGTLVVPHPAHGCILFAHGSGSNRMSPRNRAVSGALQDAGFATLLFDLLTPAEAADRANVFDIPLLAARVGAALDWVATQPQLRSLPTGLFGASTGAAAAIVAAADHPARVRAVVSRGGRPDLAGGHLGKLDCPTLLIVGGADTDVLALNRQAQRHLHCENTLSIIPRATHLFVETGAMEEVARLTRNWFEAALK